MNLNRKHMLRAIIHLPFLLFALLLLGVAWLGASLRGEPEWIIMLAGPSALLLTCAWILAFSQHKRAKLARVLMLSSGGLLCLAIFAHLFLIEPRKDRLQRARNHYLLRVHMQENAIHMEQCGETILVIAPGIVIRMESEDRQLYELYLLKSPPDSRPLKLANTRFDGELSFTPEFEKYYGLLLDCLGTESKVEELINILKTDVRYCKNASTNNN